MPWRSAYISSKFALEGLCDTLRQETYGSRIHISLLEPGPITSHFRPNALVKFKQYINIENSVHRDVYLAQLNRLQAQGSVAPFTLTAKQCATVCARALNAKKPKARYFVTVPAHLFWYLKKCLPICILDELCRLAAIHKQGKQS